MVRSVVINWATMFQQIVKIKVIKWSANRSYLDTCDNRIVQWFTCLTVSVFSFLHGLKQTKCHFLKLFWLYSPSFEPFYFSHFFGSIWTVHFSFISINILTNYEKSFIQIRAQTHTFHLKQIDKKSACSRHEVFLHPLSHDSLQKVKL